MWLNVCLDVRGVSKKNIIRNDEYMMENPMAAFNRIENQGMPIKIVWARAHEQERNNFFEELKCYKLKELGGGGQQRPRMKWSKKAF